MVLFMREKQNVDEVRSELYVKMKIALTDYTRTLQEYNCTIAEFGEGSSIANVFYAKLDHYRTEYHQLRLQYEELYGDVESYQSSLSRVTNWSKTNGTRMLMRPLFNESSLAR